MTPDTKTTDISKENFLKDPEQVIGDLLHSNGSITIKESENPIAIIFSRETYETELLPYIPECSYLTLEELTGRTKT